MVGAGVDLQVNEALVPLLLHTREDVDSNHDAADDLVEPSTQSDVIDASSGIFYLDAPGESGHSQQQRG